MVQEIRGVRVTSEMYIYSSLIAFFHNKSLSSPSPSEIRQKYLKYVSY